MYKRLLVALSALLLMLSAACLAEVENIADQCRFWVNQGSASEISDNSMGSAWKPKGDAEMRVMLPDSGAAWIQINWSIPPQDYTLAEYDANQNQLSSRTATAEENFGCISQLIPVGQGVKFLSVKFNQQGQGINKVRVFPEGELPSTVVQWEKPHDKCDLLVVSTHQDDEWLWFGAIIPYYDLVKDKDVQLVYMANCGRLRYAEALNSVAVSGVKTYPYFTGLPDKRDSSLAAAVQTWKSKDFIVETMAGIIRRFKPEVILTHDWKGEYGHPQHILTSRCMEYAIEAAADPNQYPESAQQYGTWQVKKLYRHLEKKGRIEFDWHVAYPEFGGRTGIQVATDSMKQDASQLKYYQVEDHGKYDNALFGLSWSAVGDDELHEDLFEHIDAPESTPESTFEPVSAPDVGPSDGFEGASEVFATGEADALDAGEAGSFAAGLSDAGADGLNDVSADGLSDAGADGLSDAGADGLSDVSADGLNDVSADGLSDAGADGLNGVSADGLNGAGADGLNGAGADGLSDDPSAGADGGFGEEPAPGVTAPPESTEERGGSAVPIAIGIGVGVAACGGLGYALYMRQRRLRHKRRRRKLVHSSAPRHPGASRPAASRSAASRPTAPRPTHRTTPTHRP